MGDIEAGHQQRAAVVEDDRRRLGVCPDVELADGAAVAERAPAHERDAGDLVGEVGRPPEGQRDVGQRPDGDDPQARLAAARLDEEGDGIVASRPGAGFDEGGAVEAAGTVDVAGGDLLGEQRTRRAGVHGRVDASRSRITRALCVVRVQRRVAGHRRDPDELAQVGGDDDGDGVVVTRVAVEDDAWLWRRRLRAVVVHGRSFKPTPAS